MVDEDLLNTDLVITGREGFSVNLDSREWRSGESIKRLGRVLLIIGGSAFGFAILPSVIEAMQSHTVVTAVGTGIMGAGFAFYRWGERIIDDYINARVKAMEDAGELIK